VTCRSCSARIECSGQYPEELLYLRGLEEVQEAHAQQGLQALRSNSEVKHVSLQQDQVFRHHAHLAFDSASRLLEHAGRAVEEHSGSPRPQMRAGREEQRPARDVEHPSIIRRRNGPLRELALGFALIIGVAHCQWNGKRLTFAPIFLLVGLEVLVTFAAVARAGIRNRAQWRDDELRVRMDPPA